MGLINLYCNRDGTTIGKGLKEYNMTVGVSKDLKSQI